MQQIEFVRGSTRLIFNTLKRPFNCDAVPRIGETVEVRHIGDAGDQSMFGVVEDVRWYFSTSNTGGIAVVYLAED